MFFPVFVPIFRPAGPDAGEKLGAVPKSFEIASIVA